MKYPRENDIGKIEYKLILSSLDEDRLESLATQMRFRLEEGNGEAFYVLGVSNEGDVIGMTEEEMKTSLEVLERVAELINARVVYKRIVEVRKGRQVAEVVVRLFKEQVPIEINVAVMGHVNAGKSTLTGVLISGKYDDGNGSLRAVVARHLHEVISGRTSSISMRLLGFDDNGEVVNRYVRDPLDEADITMKSSKVVRLIDLGGHERYLRTTLKGLLGYDVNYVMLVVGADDGLSIMGREHLAIASILKFPVFVVITKVDKYPRERIDQIINDVKSVLKIPGINRLALEVEDEGDLLNSILAMRTGRVVPIFKVSNVTGEGIDLLVKLLNVLPPSGKKMNDELPLVYIDEIYNVTGVGTVVLGSVVRGSVSSNDDFFIGPDKVGEFHQIKVKSIQLNRIFVDKVKEGYIATFAIQGLNKESLRKGMIMSKSKKTAVRRFKARIFILHHPTTIREGYVATMHLYTIRQAVRFDKIYKNVLRSGDSSEVILRFLYNPEYIEKGQIFVFREGRTRGIGVVLEPLA